MGILNILFSYFERMISDLSQILIEPYVVSSSIRHLIWVTASWEIIDLCKRLKNEPHSSKKSTGKGSNETAERKFNEMEYMQYNNVYSSIAYIF